MGLLEKIQHENKLREENPRLIKECSDIIAASSRFTDTLAQARELNRTKQYKNLILVNKLFSAGLLTEIKKENKELRLEECENKKRTLERKIRDCEEALFIFSGSGGGLTWSLWFITVVLLPSFGFGLEGFWTGLLLGWLPSTFLGFALTEGPKSEVKSLNSEIESLKSEIESLKKQLPQ